MSWISGLAKQRVEQALQSLRDLVPDVESILLQQFGPNWQAPVGKIVRRPSNTDLKDVRFLLKILGWRQGNGSPLISLPGVNSSAANRLKEIADIAAHKFDSRWTPGSDIEAERIAASFLVVFGKRPQRAIASLLDRHEEMFVLGDTAIRHRWYPADLSDPQSTWSDWAAMECSAATSIAAAGQSNRLDVFILTTSGIIEQRTWNLEGDPKMPAHRRDGRWTSWRGLPNGGMTVSGPITATSRTAGHLEIFAFGEQGETVHRWAWNDNWVRWHRFG